MNTLEHQKVTASHLARKAYLYVRQSTLRQVVENTESTQRQYALRRRAVTLGWAENQIVVIDSDLGHSGASMADRAGFQRLVAEVGMGQAGIVMGLEVSRLARNCTDWHRLLEICALTETLLLDEDGLYDPKHFNDRLVLGLKGTMSEAELHLLGARLRGGVLSKASRGELRLPLPVGFLYDSEGRVALDPDLQVQEAIRHVFRTFQRIGSAFSAIKALRHEGVLFPRRVRHGTHEGELMWAAIDHTRLLQLLHNPRYAGAFFYGRIHFQRNVEGRVVSRKLPREQWHTLLPDAHPGYISWEEYEENQRRLQQMAQAYGIDRVKRPPREGPALLQGMVVCGRCGRRMTVRYNRRYGHEAPTYYCQALRVNEGAAGCQVIPGTGIDVLVGNVIVEAVTPLALEVALRVQEELHARLAEAERLRHKQVERARYETDLARRRYMQVDPDNRLVADTLEAEWNTKLRAMAEAERVFQQGCQADRAVVSESQREAVLGLASDFPRLWKDPKTPQRERKRMLRLLIDDVTLVRDKQITLHIRFKGGVLETRTLPLPRPAWELRKTPPEVLREIDRLLDHHTCPEIASVLNERGLRSGPGLQFNTENLSRVIQAYGIKTRYERLRAQGMLTGEEMAERLGVTPDTIRNWRKHGLVTGFPYSGKHECLYPFPVAEPPMKLLGRKLDDRRPHGSSNARGAV